MEADAGQLLPQQPVLLRRQPPPAGTGPDVDDTGGLRRFVNVYVDEEDVRFGDGLQTPVTDGSELQILPAVAGG